MTMKYPDTHHDVTSNTLFGFWIYLMTDFILFATFFAAYAVLHNGVDSGPTAREIFSLPYALSETLILLVSSFTCGMALLSIPLNKNKTMGWFAVTFPLGVVFMMMELSEFLRLIHDGNSWTRSAFLSSYFALAGLHGLHIIGGLLFMLVFMVQFMRRGFTDATIRRLTCLCIFWFFSYVIWIFMFSFVYLMGAS